MTSYASGTRVSVNRTRDEIEHLLYRYGADGFAYAQDAGRVMIGFRIQGRMVRMDLPLPSIDDRDIQLTPTGKRRTEAQREKVYEDEIRRRWRALALIVKAKLEAVQSGISTIEREFFADIVMPNGQTLGEWAHPQIEHAYQTAEMPALLPGRGG